MKNEEIAEQFFLDWDKGKDFFDIQSSGSTGKPKPIRLERRWMEWSAKQTGKAFQVSDSDSMFCCLPLNRVGGLMMLVRSKVWNIPLLLGQVSAHPFEAGFTGSIVSLTPFQLYHILKQPSGIKQVESFRHVLLGGSDLALSLEKRVSEINSDTAVWLGYGMTETYSHIALRRLNGINQSVFYTCFDGVTIEQNKEHCAVIFAPFAKDGLLSRDLIELQGDNTFKVNGRLDFVINTGGVKIQTEEVERLIDKTLEPKSAFAISSLPSDEYGEMLILVCEQRSDFENQDFEFLNVISPYAKPKTIIELPEIPRLEGSKINRLLLKRLISN